MVAAIETPCAPLLTVTRSNSTVTVSWPGVAGNFILEQTLGLAPAEPSWTPPTLPYQTNGPLLFITEPLPGGSKFYRLRKP